MDDREFFDDLLDRVFSEENVSQLRHWIDEERVGVDPLTDIPESKLTLYGLVGIFSSKFFATLDELKDFLENLGKEFRYYYIVEYLGDMAGYSDVIKITYMHDGDDKKHEQYFTPTGAEQYGVYNHERSIYCGEHIWEGHDGDYLQPFFDALKKHGLQMKHDYWAERDALLDSMMRAVRESKLYY